MPHTPVLPITMPMPIPSHTDMTISGRGLPRPEPHARDSELGINELELTVENETPCAFYVRFPDGWRYKEHTQVPGEPDSVHIIGYFDPTGELKIAVSGDFGGPKSTRRHTVYFY